MEIKITVERTDQTGQFETVVYNCNEADILTYLSEARKQGYISLLIEQIKQVESQPEVIYVAVKKEGNQIFFNHVDAQICSKEVLIYEKREWL